MTKSTREDILLIVRDTFRRYGYDSTSLQVLSQETGLNRSSLYHYFPRGKQQMAEESLTVVSEYFDDTLIPFLKGSAAPADKVQFLTQQLTDYYEDGKLGCIFLALGSPACVGLFRESLKKLLQCWVDGMATVAVQAGLSDREAQLRAEQVVADLQGAMLLSNIHGDATPFERSIERIPEFLHIDK